MDELHCKSCGEDVEALNQYHECEQCWRTALEDALPWWEADACSFEVMWIAS